MWVNHVTVLFRAQVRNKDAMGSYTCSFKTGKTLHGHGTFHVKGKDSYFFVSLLLIDS